MADDREEKQGFSIARLEQFQNLPKWQLALFDRIAILFLFLIILIVFGTLIGLLITFLDFGSDEAKITAESFNKILLGIGAVLAVPFLIWRTMIAQDQNKIAQENIHSTTMAKAIEQLGAMKEEKITHGRVIPDGNPPPETVTNSKPNIEVRLGAIYLLEKLAREHRDLHWPIMEILCAYVRGNAGPPKSPPSGIVDIYKIQRPRRTLKQRRALEEREKKLGRPRVDIQVALTVIGRRTVKQLEWEKRFAVLNKRSYRLDLSNCHLANIVFSGLEFSQANLSGSSLENADLSEARFEGADLFKAHLEGVNLYNAHFEEAYFYGAHLEGAYLREAHLEGAALPWAHVKGTICYEAHLEGANLRLANLEGADLLEAHLEGSDLWQSDLEGTTLYGAHFNDTKIDNADLSKAVNVTQEMIDKAWGNSGAQLPEGIDRPVNERWAKDESEDNDERNERWQERRDYWLEFAKKRASEEAGD